MVIEIKPASFFLFDLDDTLYPESDFMQSGYRYISSQLAAGNEHHLFNEMMRRHHAGVNVFQWLAETYIQAPPAESMAWLLQQYREHFPDISLSPSAGRFLRSVRAMGIPAGLISDGRSITQRNKLKALGIESDFSDIIISEEFGSEKPDERNFRYFADKYPGRSFYFFGDSTEKDFEVPARLGWKTICLADTGRHIHRQKFFPHNMPTCLISSFDEITLSNY